MKTYIGVKVIEAEPQDRMIAPNEAYPIGKREVGYHVIYADGYESWSPKDVFEEAYREVRASDAPIILSAVREEIERLSDGEAFSDLLARSGPPTAADLRQAALYQAIQSFGPNMLPPTAKDLLDRASAIAEWLNPGTDALLAAEQRGYDRARPLDPERVEIGGE